ncbi:MAG: DNA-binding protein HU-beta [Solirubrobacteraceae bacterium]|nr:DNA-binding protein HU-beta [Solirubrobacteraceae bacterium]
MTKADLIELVAQRSRLSRRDAGRALDTTIELIEETLAAGGEVSLSGFGKFHVSSRGARAGVHPRTGAPIWVEATRVPRFTAGSALKKAVRG